MEGGTLGYDSMSDKYIDLFFFLNTCFEKSFFFLQTGWLREKGRIWLNEITVVAEVDDDALGNGMMNAFQVRSGT